MMIGDKISQVIGVESEGLKRLFFFIFFIGNTVFLLFTLIGLINHFFFPNDDFNSVLYVGSLGLLLFTPVYFIILFILFQLIINPIIWIVDGFDDKK